MMCVLRTIIVGAYNAHYMIIVVKVVGRALPAMSGEARPTLDFGFRLNDEMVLETHIKEISCATQPQNF